MSKKSKSNQQQAVLDLLQKAKERRQAADKEYEREKNVAYANHSAAVQDCWALINVAQELCDHDAPVRIEHDFDYHKREDWTETFCTICGKQLSRE